MNRVFAFVVTVLLAVFVGYLVGTYGFWALATVGALTGILALTPHPALALSLFFASVVLGQLVRIPIGGGAVVISDIVLSAVLAASLWRWLLTPPQFPKSRITTPLIVFAAVALLSIGAALRFLPLDETIRGLLYFVRLALYLSLFFIALSLAPRGEWRKTLLGLLLGSASLLAVLGFAQLIIFPDFSFMVPQGWDPHIGRLLSTWFDPNLLGGFLAATALIALALFIERRQILFLAVFLVLATALFLTFSRSAAFAFAIGFALLTLWRSWPLFLAGVIAVGALLATSPRLQERIEGALEIDVTASARITSWTNTAKIIEDHPILGVGYNTLRDIQFDYGFSSDTTEHSAGGSDSSLLTVWATTGAVGLLVFLWLLAAMLLQALHTYRHAPRRSFARGLAAGLAVAIPTLLIHSQFTNSLLYPHVLGPLLLLYGVLGPVNAKSEARSTKQIPSTKHEIRNESGSA